MSALPIQYLYVEAVILFIFLVLVLLIQLARTRDATHYLTNSRRQMAWALLFFGMCAILFPLLLARVSPLLGVELAAGGLLSLLHPVNALCFFVHLLYLRPWEVAVTNPLLLALPRGLAVLCFLSWAVHPAHHANPNSAGLRALNVLLLFSGWLFLSTFFTPHIAETQADWLGIYFKSLILFVMCLYFIDSERSVAEFKLSLLVSALAFMAIRWLPLPVGSIAGERLETGGMFGDPNDMAAILVMALPFALVPAFDRTIAFGQRLIGLIFAGLSVAMIWHAQSRGAMLGLAAQAFAFGLLKTRGKSRVPALALAAILGVGYCVALKALPRAPDEMHASSESRITYWKTAVNMALHNPLFGVGYSQYPANYDRYSVGAKYEWGLRTAHSSWFLALGESGFVGAILFITFFVMILKTAWRNRGKWPDQLYSVVGYGVVMSFLSHTYLTDIYLLGGLIMASDALLHRTAHE